jgi:hypothetical protein
MSLLGLAPCLLHGELLDAPAFEFLFLFALLALRLNADNNSTVQREAIA